MVPAGPQSQIHDTVVFPYRGYYLALFEAQRDQHFLDIELAFSRDGANFLHVKPGRKVVPLGPPGDWDWQMLLPTTPVVAADELRLYYAGLAPPRDQSNKLVPGDENLICQPGLATLRLVGFTHLQLKKGSSTGQVTTVPFVVKDSQPLQLLLNAACSPRARISVEILDAQSGQPLPGYARGDATACQENAVRQVVRWGDKDRLRLRQGERIALRFRLEGDGVSPMFYAFAFESPRL